MSSIQTFDISNANETLALAKDLQKFITDNKLSTQLHGKAYVNVEGWQYAGSRLGILPVVEELFNLGDEREIKYLARVKLLNLNGDADATPDAVVGSGYAVCSNQENGKRHYQEFAIASMAQTRAIGKAYRNLLAWIIRAAGYEPTPAEEMEADSNATASNPAQGGATATDPAPAVAAQPAETPPAGPAPTPYVKPASNKQKADILLLLSHRQITAEEKERTVRGIQSLSSERAQTLIGSLKKVIRQRQADQDVA